MFPYVPLGLPRTSKDTLGPILGDFISEPSFPLYSPPMTPEQKILQLFHRGCADYNLLEDGDRVLIALSGGKDSLELVRLLGRQQRILKPRINVAAAHVLMDNIPYDTDRSYLTRFCEDHGVPLTIIHTSFREENDVTPRPGRRLHHKPRCFLCSWARRKALFEYARDNGYNKLALGHHQDDILITMLMNMTFEGTIQTMTPRLKMEHYPVTIIRPLCLVPEQLIKDEAARLCFEHQKTPCPYEEVTNRQAMTGIFHQLEALNPEARYSLWRALVLNTP